MRFFFTTAVFSVLYRHLALFFWGTRRASSALAQGCAGCPESPGKGPGKVLKFPTALRLLTIRHRIPNVTEHRLVYNKRMYHSWGLSRIYHDKKDGEKFESFSRSFIIKYGRHVGTYEVNLVIRTACFFSYFIY